MKKLSLLVLLSAAMLVTSIAITPSASAAGFNAGTIIDDGVFTDATSMNAQQIQEFLNSKVPVCDTNGTQPSEYGGGTRSQWGQAKYGQGSFVCLKDYSEGGRSAAQIIYDSAQQYGISPKVILVLLQKEQSLVTDTWPLNIQYRSATGYGCPDTAACDSQYYGLTNQISWAAKMFRAIMNDSPTWYTPYVLGNNFIRYSPDASCGGSTVNITNRATQALYNYTPYQPNAGALAAGWGSASCGAYGNRNFYLYFTSWFGSTTATPSYGYSIVSREIYADANYTVRLSDTPSVEPGSTFYVKLSIKNTGNQVWTKNSIRIGGEGPKDRSSGFYTPSWINAGRVATSNETNVAGGETGTFSFAMKAPAELGDYSEQFGLLIENQRWLDGTFTLPVTVATTANYYAVKNVSFETFSDAALTKKTNPQSITAYTGSKVYVKAVVKNIGNRPLPANTTKIGTANPLERISPYQSSDWLSGGNRAAKAQEGAIAPGSNGTFVFTLTAPSTVQARSQEQFGLLIEGQAWLSQNIGSVSIETQARPPQLLGPNQILYKDASLVSADERYKLVLQSDGNLVLYSQNRALWATWTVGKGGAMLVMQSDGNLVLYRADWTAVWSSNTGGKGTSNLLLQSDGNLVNYATSGQALWHTVTGGQQ